MKRQRRESSFCNNCKQIKTWYLSGGRKIPQGRCKGAHGGSKGRRSQAGPSGKYPPPKTQVGLVSGKAIWEGASRNAQSGGKGWCLNSQTSCELPKHSPHQPQVSRIGVLGRTSLRSCGMHLHQPTHVLCTQTGQTRNHRRRRPRMALSHAHCSDDSRQNRNHTHITWG